MFDNENEINLFGSYTTTEEKIDTSNNQSNDFPQTEIETKKQTKQEIYEDDYSSAQSFKEETNYDLKPHKSSYSEIEQEQRYKPIKLPTIETKEEEKVVVQEKEQPIQLNARMKLLLTSFIVIVASLVFATVWNFVAISKLNSSIANKAEMANQLQVSINTLSEEYNLLGNIDNLKELIEDAGFIESNDSNTITISLEEVYTEHRVSEIPSNWFNDVCNFISSLFK